MGWFFDRHSSALAGAQMIRIFRLFMWFVLGFVISVVTFSSAYAASVNLKFKDYTRGATTSTGTVAGSTAAANSGAFITNSSVTAMGKLVDIPATATIAANAASFAVTAVRASPGGLVTGLVASWLLGYGLEWAVDHWTKNPPDYEAVSAPNGYQYRSNYTGAPWRNTPDEAAHDYAIWLTSQGCCTGKTVVSWSATALTFPSYRLNANLSGSYSNNQTAIHQVSTLSCPDGGTLTGSTCITPPVTAVEADFTPASTGAIPDAAVQQLAQANVPMPVNNPIFQPIDVPISEPRLDPISNRYVQDRLSVTQPNPSTAPDVANVVPYTVDAGDIPQQTTAPQVLPQALPDAGVTSEAKQPTDQQTDCDKFPDSLGCIEVGTAPVDDVIGAEQRSFSVSPVSIGGTGACHADIPVVTSRMSFTIPMAAFCDALGWLRPLVIALSWLTAAMIITSAVKEP